jgi:hypothetical protein
MQRFQTSTQFSTAWTRVDAVAVSPLHQSATYPPLRRGSGIQSSIADQGPTCIIGDSRQCTRAVLQWLGVECRLDGEAATRGRLRLRRWIGTTMGIGQRNGQGSNGRIGFGERSGICIRIRIDTTSLRLYRWDDIRQELAHEATRRRLPRDMTKE